MRRSGGFTLIEMMVSTGLFIAGALFVYSTFSGVTKSSRSVTVDVDLGSYNKQALTRIFSEMQASSLTAQDTDGLDSTEPEPVLTIEDDLAAPKPQTKAVIVNRRTVGSATDVDGTWEVGGGRMQAREMSIATSKRVRFRKVIGYQFNASAGSITPEWSRWVTYAVNDRSQLVRSVDGGASRIIAQNVDAFDVQARVDNTLLVTLITAKRDPSNPGWRRYANSITVHPKN
ncbi:MAG: prepilin-type N-terminal cleavage/methylation domain-containing protein [Planctomycetes bacterium]|nr:prepilin-type N-terminal cleavage/methylation domain-containing protein [Planctomycetota bacterium]